MRKQILCPLLGALLVGAPGAGPAGAQDVRSDSAVVRTIADRVLADATFDFVAPATGARYRSLPEAPPDAELRPAAYNDWRYWNGVLNLAMLHLGAVLHEPRYAEFASRNVAFAFASYPYFQQRYHGQDKWSYPFAQRFITEELDDYGAMGASVLEVYATSPRPQYRAYVQNAAAWLDTRQGRLEDGTLVRSFPRRWTLWADDLFMAVPFLARMSQLSGDPRYLDDAAHQVASYFRYLFNDDTGLMVHNWYSDTGRPGVAYWGRANGWALLAEVELLDRLPEQHAQRDTVLALFRRHIVGVARYQGANGLWHQLLDKPDSYEETSASAMFTYAIAHAVLRGYIPDSYAPVAQRGWAGVRTRIRVDGQIEGVCSGTVVSDNLTDYYQRPTPLNDVHGVGAVLWAGAEMIALQARR